MNFKRNSSLSPVSYPFKVAITKSNEIPKFSANFLSNEYDMSTEKKIETMKKFGLAATAFQVSTF